MGVNSVSARQILWRLPRGKHILSTDGTVVFVLVLEALMRIKHTNRNAHTTLIAVTKGIPSAHTAETTLIAVEWLFGHGHPEVAPSAMVFSKDDFTIDTLVSVANKQRKKEDK